jgi:pimeloyl-ACP methyl ester carboxylesterase
MAHRWVDVGRLRLHCVEAGTGPLVVLLHGFPEFWYAWRHQLPALANAGYRVVAPDLPGYNTSDKPARMRDYRPKVLTQDVADLIAALGASSAAVAGHDWGGGLAWLLAMHHPERIQRLVVLNAPYSIRFLKGLRSPRQLRRSWYILAFQLPWLPERLIAARDFQALRRALRRQLTRPGAFTAQDIDRYVAADLRSEFPQQVLDASVSRHVLICSMTSSGGASMHWRTSIGASAAPLIRAAISTARASFSTSTTQNPTSDARDSANGPSVATGTPCWTLTVLAWLGSASPCWNTSSPDSVSSTSIRCMNSIISLIHSGDLPSSADVSPNVMIMYFISSLPISAPGTGARTSETEPRQHLDTAHPQGSTHTRNEMRPDPLEGVRTLQWSGLHPSHASGIRTP